jgi:hypothetical protein
MKFPHRLIRNLHLATTPLLGAFVYSGALREIDAFVVAVQWAAFPLAAGAGLALWLGPRLARRAARGGAPR